MRQYVPKIDDADVQRVVRRDFPSDQWEVVLALLQLPVQLPERPSWVIRRYLRQDPPGVWVRTQRAQAALVKVSRGDIDHLRRCLEFDVDEVVHRAEYPNVMCGDILDRRTQTKTVSEAKQWCEECSRLSKADAEQYLEWLNGPFIVRSENGF